MNKVKILTIVSAILIVLNIALLAFVFSHKRPRKDEGPRHLIVEKLQFDASQTQQFDGLVKAHRETICQADKDIVALKNQLYNCLIEENEVKKDSLMLEIGKIQVKIEQTHYQHFEDIRRICGEKNKQQFIALSKEIATLFKSSNK
jgi:periplasmic protein CpxP/Spy